MQPGRLPAALCASLLLLAACGREAGPDVSSDRIVASPVASPTGSPGTSPTPTPTGTPHGATPVTAAPRVTAVPRTPSPASNLANANVKLTRVATLDQPIAMAIRKGDPAFYVAEQGGRVKRVSGGKVGATVLDISNQISTGGEQGLLGLAFSPDGKRLYVYFTETGGDIVISEYAFQVAATNRRQVLAIEHSEFGNHNGGNLAFGHDGFLYIGTGDGGGGGDPHANAQDIDEKLGKMLRIDPRAAGGQSYRSPSSNPFVGKDGDDAIYATGLRNPWRFSFDRETGELWIGDVGQGSWEEIDFDAGDGGDNYGWDRMEGTHSFDGGSAPTSYHGPIYEYANGGDNCAVTGGYVYRGSKIGNLRGAYVFADHCAGKLRAFVQHGGAAQNHRFLGPRAPSVTSFGEDANGELYVLSLEGGFFRIDPV